MIYACFYMNDSTIILIKNHKNQYIEITMTNNDIKYKEIKKEDLHDWFWAMDYRKKDLYNLK